MLASVVSESSFGMSSRIVKLGYTPKYVLCYHTSWSPSTFINMAAIGTLPKTKLAQHWWILFAPHSNSVFFRLFLPQVILPLRGRFQMQAPHSLQEESLQLPYPSSWSSSLSSLLLQLPWGQGGKSLWKGLSLIPARKELITSKWRCTPWKPKTTCNMIILPQNKQKHWMKCASVDTLVSDVCKEEDFHWYYWWFLAVVKG